MEQQYRYISNLDATIRKEMFIFKLTGFDRVFFAIFCAKMLHVDSNIKKQLPVVFCKKRLRPATLLKKRLRHRCFLVNFAKFLCKKRLRPATLLKKRLRAQVFPCEFCKIFKNIFFTEHHWVSASEHSSIYSLVICYTKLCKNHTFHPLPK